MENLVWLLCPTIGVVIVITIVGMLRMLSLRRAKHLGIASAVSAGLLGLLFAPRCLCSDVAGALLASAAFAVLLGVLICVLFLLGSRVFNQILRPPGQRTPQSTEAK